ncbi:sorting nexin-10-like isoform X2 [Biomphalaria glabrata]|uniref:Sorting nexin-10-like isoform X2 n=1 Tax=Biomphalaria glabrata TaxID=6526 RepID=A0A9U8ECP4_BIOGL|nr:sorting nexin-10-like isoform X2 [Biomphalaria glabrata]KAI8778431.1 sorting nexin-10 isoform X1 [Biomphalaria glabrata]
MDFDLLSSYEIPLDDLLPRIMVKDPVTHSTWEDGKFTSYLICIKTNHPAFHLPMSAVRRRFSELVWLAKVLKANHQYVSFPTFPPKTVWAERFNEVFINERMKLIENYLNELLVTDTVLSDAAFHLFLQTDLTKEEMEEYFAGRLSDEFIESAWKNVGHVHTSPYVVNINTVPCQPQEISMNEEDLRQNKRKLSGSMGSSAEHSVNSTGPSSNTQTATKQLAYAEVVPTSSTVNEEKSIASTERNHTSSVGSSDFEISLQTDESIKLRFTASKH